METIGKINNTDSMVHNVEWVIPNFFSLSEEDDKYYNSHTFFFNGEFWYLRIYPIGDEKDNSAGYVDIFLRRKSPGPEISQDFCLSLKNAFGKKVKEKHLTYVFKEVDMGYGFVRLISRSELSEKKSELLPADALTVVCTLNYTKSYASANDSCACQDYKKVMLDGLNHDLILQVGDQELRAHQDILRARSKVFESMLSHDMKEKNSGVINIADCDPEAMKQFLCYIYTGKVDTLDQSNMLQLYYIADKYDAKGLKEECNIFIKNSMSLTNICEVIQLALNHSDSSLLEHATEYFMNNAVDIMRSVEWRSFMKDNFTVANELTIKSIEKFKNARM